ncbi:MAG: 50S ribosomal protein L33 [Candidatus Brocadiia bacterium]|nr:50S ribosomal protein L33 [Planctomycetota bacterium]
MRAEVTLQCSECKRRNYRTSRRREGNEKLKLKKYCAHCRKHTEHKEA